MNTFDGARCPEPGVWRAWLDHEVLPEPLEDHLSTCPACQQLVAEIREEAADVRDILSVLAPTRLPDAAEIALARERLDWRRAAATTPSPHPTHIRRLEPIPMFFSRLSTPWRFAASGVAAALLVGLLVAFTPEGGAVAASILSQFRSQQVTAIDVSPQSQAEITKTLNALGNLGTISGPGASGEMKPAAAARAAEGQMQTVTLAEASQAVGFPLLTPDPANLPGGLPATPQVHTMPSTQIQFTFNKAKAVAYFQSTGHPEVSVPDKFDGAKLTVTIPAAAILEYGDKQAKSAMVIAEAGEVVADVQGNVSLPEMRDFLLGVPGLPPSVVSQLKGIQNWNDTLPIPVPVDYVNWQSVTINGNKGLLLNDNSGVGSAAIWHANGHLLGVGGSLKATDLKRVADGMVVR